MIHFEHYKFSYNLNMYTLGTELVAEKNYSREKTIEESEIQNKPTCDTSSMPPEASLSVTFNDISGDNLSTDMRHEMDIMNMSNSPPSKSGLNTKYGLGESGNHNKEPSESVSETDAMT